MTIVRRHLMTRAGGTGEFRRLDGPPPQIAELADAVELRTIETVVEALEPFEVRRDGETANVVGHAAVFERLSEDLGFPGFSFRERIKRGAFRRALDENQDVRFLIEHDPRWILGRTAAGTLELSEDPRGLRTFSKMDLRQTYASDLAYALERGDVTQMSFGFSVREDAWLERHLEDGSVEVIRDVIEIERLLDVSTVTFPAYPQTDVSLRGLKIAGFEIQDGDGSVLEDPLRELARRSFAGELELTERERSAVDSLFSRIDSVSPWTAQRALRAIDREPELQGVVQAVEGEQESTPHAAGEQASRPLLGARRRRLSLLGS